MRELHDAPEAFQLAVVHAEVAHAAQLRVLAQQAHHDRLAVKHRNDGDADVHLVRVHADFDATVLRHALLGDVQVRKDFDARDNRGLEALQRRRHRDFLQVAVNPVTDAELVFEGFEVNVGRAQLNGVAKDLVHEADDARVLGGAVEVVVRDAFLHHFEAGLLVERADGVRADAEMLLHLAGDGLGRRENGLERKARHSLEGIEALRGEKPAGGDFHAAVGALEGEEMLLQQHPRGKQREHLTVRLDGVERSKRHVVFLRQPAEGGVLSGGAALLGEGLRVQRRELPVGNHPLQQLPQRRVRGGQLAHPCFRL